MNEARDEIRIDKGRLRRVLLSVLSLRVAEDIIEELVGAPLDRYGSRMTQDDRERLTAKLRREGKID